MPMAPPARGRRTCAQQSLVACGVVVVALALALVLEAAPSTAVAATPRSLQPHSVSAAAMSTGRGAWRPIAVPGSGATQQAREQGAARVAAATALLGAAQGGRCACSDRREAPSLTSHPAPSPQCPLGCSGHGTCNGVCRCEKGWGGPACGLALPKSAASAASLLTVVVAVGDGTNCKAAVKDAVAALPAGMEGVQVVTARPADPRNDKPWEKPSNKDRKKPPKPQSGNTVGKVLNTALERVSTPYAVVLSGRDTLSPGVTAAGIVSAMRSSGLVVAGGLVTRRGSGGARLLPACHALRAKNYTLDAMRGWSTSWGGCMVCDHTSQSFVVDVARFPGFDTDVLEPQLAGVALSLQLVRGVAKQAVSIGACPGAIQFREIAACHAKPLSANRLEKAARALTRSHPIARWNLADGTFVHFCGFGTKKGKKNQVNDVCVYHRHMRDLFIIKRHLDRQGLDYVLTEGAMLSALKFRKLMPWDYDIDMFVFMDDWSKMKHLVEPSGFRAELKKDKMDWQYVRTDPRATVFKARWGVDIDMYFIVINTDKTFRANSKLVKADFEPYTSVIDETQPDKAGRQQRHTISWRNVVETTEEQRKRTGLRFAAPTADIWVHGQWMGIRRYSFPNQMAKYGSGPALLHVTRAMGSKVGEMYEGRYGEKALTYRAQYCDDPSSTGCLDGWVWFMTWQTWSHTRLQLPATADSLGASS